MKPRKANGPSVGPDLQFLIRKCDATHALNGRTQDDGLIDEFRKLRNEIEERTEDTVLF